MQAIDARIDEGVEALAAGRRADAVVILKGVLAEDGEKWRAWRGLGQAHLEGGLFAEAAQAFERATVIRPDDAESQYGFGASLAGLGDHGKAIPHFESALRYDAHHDRARSAMAISMLARAEDMRGIGNLLAVEEYLEKAHRADPRNGETVGKLLGYYRQTGQPFKEADLLREAEKLGLDIAMVEGVAHRVLGGEQGVSLDGASRSDLEAAVSANGEDWRAWRGLGFAQIDAGENDLATESFRRATVIRPDDGMSQYGLGLTLQAAGDHGKAIKAFEEGLARGVEKPDEVKRALSVSLLFYSEHMRGIGNLLAVEQYLERAHKVDPSNGATSEKLLEYYAQTGQSAKSAVVLQELTRLGLPIPVIHAHEMSLGSSGAGGAVEERLDNAEGWLDLRASGFKKLEAGDFAGAVEDFKRATVIRPDDAENQYGLGLAYQKSGDHARAINPFEEALAHDNRHEEARAALKVSLLGYVDHMEEIGNLLAVEQYLEKAYQADQSDEGVKGRLIAYYNSTGQSFKSATLSGAAGVAPPAVSSGPDRVSAFGDDILLASERVATAPPALGPGSVSGGGSTLGAGSDPLNPAAPGGSGSAIAAGQAPRAMAACPSCKQMMLPTSRLCPHCSAVVDLITGRVLSGQGDQPGQSAANSFYKAVSFVRILAGLAFLGLAGFGTGAVTGTMGAVALGIVGGWMLLSGAGLLLEWDWLQTVVYWGSFLQILVGVAGVAMGLMGGLYVGIAFDVVSIVIAGATVLAISKWIESGG